jgi:serine/threonine protein kinase
MSGIHPDFIPHGLPSVAAQAEQQQSENSPIEKGFSSGHTFTSIPSEKNSLLNVSARLLSLPIKGGYVEFSAQPLSVVQTSVGGKVDKVAQQALNGSAYHVFVPDDPESQLEPMPSSNLYADSALLQSYPAMEKTAKAFEKTIFKHNTGRMETRKYEIVELAGSGKYKTAYIVKNASKSIPKIVTLPTALPTTPSEKKEVENEQHVNQKLYALKKEKGLSFQHVVTSSKVSLVGNPQAIGYKSEYGNGGTLDSRLSRLTDNDKRKISKFLVAGMQEMHGVNLLHRDVKADNVVVFLNEKGEIENLKYIDMGKAKFTDDNVVETKPQALYVGLRPPEYYGKEGLPTYTEKSDIYQLGLALWQVNCGISVHNLLEGMGAPSNEYVRGESGKYINNPAGWHGMDTLDPSLREIILRMRDRDPNNRPSLDEVMSVLNGSHFVKG